MAGCLDEMQKPIRNSWDTNAKSTILIILQLTCNIISATKYSINSNLGFKNISFFFWPHHTACGILVPWTGIEPGPLALDLQGIPSRTFLYPYGAPNHRGLAKCWEKGMEQMTIFFKASICLYFHNGVHFKSIFLRTLGFFVLNLDKE